MSHQISISRHFQKKSCFSNKLEEEIAVSDFSLTDDPHIAEGVGTKTVDDEGITTQKNNLIESGIFKSTFSNLFDGYKENIKSTGNGSRVGSPMGRSAEPISICSPT